MMACWLRCCTSRWRKFWTSGVALRGGGFKPPTGALAEDRGVERRGKRREGSRQVRTEKLSDGPGNGPLPFEASKSYQMTSKPGPGFSPGTSLGATRLLPRWCPA
jgi:hypothetical protein